MTSPLRITDVEVYNYRQDMVPLHKGRFTGPLEISLVRVVTDEGIEGFGSARAQGSTSGGAIGEYVVRSVKPLVVGENPLDRERIWKRLWRSLDRGTYAPVFAISAVDVAIWDAAAKILGQPLFRLLGGYQDKVTVYASSAYLPDVESYVDEARECAMRGFKGYKIHPFGDPDKDIDLCRKVRDAVPDGFHLMLDPAQAYDRIDALRVGRCLESLGFYWYEEPISHYDLDGYVQLTRALDIPVVGAETLPGSVYAANQFLRRQAADIIECDVYWKGGISGCLKLAHACEASGVRVAAHHAGSPLMSVANLHLFGGIPNGDLVEVLVPERAYHFGLTSYPAVDPDGTITLPTESGLGVMVDWEFVHNNLTSKL